MSIHVAILMRPYLQMILDGRKTIESRLTMRPIAPYQAVAAGDRIFFKASAGPFMGTAVAEEVFFFGDLNRAKVMQLRNRFNGEVCGDSAFWDWKRDSRYATFLRLAQVQPTSTGPRLAPSRGPAWFVLPDAMAPRVPVMFEVVLSAGAIKNHYLRIARSVHAFDARHYGGRTLADAGEPIALTMPDGTRIATDIVSNQMVRWRGWRPWYAAHRMQPGDVVRFVERADGSYGVAFRKVIA